MAKTITKSQITFQDLIVPLYVRRPNKKFNSFFLLNCKFFVYFWRVRLYLQSIEPYSLLRIYYSHHISKVFPMLKNKRDKLFYLTFATIFCVILRRHLINWKTPPRTHQSKETCSLKSENFQQIILFDWNLCIGIKQFLPAFSAKITS